MAVPTERLSHPKLRAEIHGFAFHRKYDMQHSSAGLAAMDATSTYYHCSNKSRRAQKQILEFLGGPGFSPAEAKFLSVGFRG
jgi:hypothetical protein